jgi:oligoribonuclease
MTGLDPENDVIIEIYCIVTDGQLELLDESGWGTVVHQTSERMSMMDEWCTRVRMWRALLLFISELAITSPFHFIVFPSSVIERLNRERLLKMV